MTDDRLSKLIHKIRALQAKADDKGTTEAESMAFAAKVQELLLEHNLSMSQVRESGEVDYASEPVVEGRFDTKYRNPWRIQLAIRIARLYFCELYLSSWWDSAAQKSRPSYVFVGRACNVEVAKHMIEYVIKRVTSLSDLYVRGNGGDSSTRDEFQRGCSLRVCHRINAIVLERTKKDEPGAVSGANALVLYEGEAERNRKYLDSLNLRKGRGGGISGKGDAAFAAGHAAGNSIGLNAQVAGAQSTKRLTA